MLRVTLIGSSVIVIASALVATACLTGRAHAQPAGTADGDALVIARVSVIDPRTGTTTPDVNVLIVDGRIADIGSGIASMPPDAHRVDGEGRFLIPGLWDMHVHLSYARESALPALVANGVTGVRDMGSDLAEIDRWRALIANGVLTGPTIVRAGPMLNGMEFNEYQLAVSDELEAKTAVRTLAKVGVDFIKLHRRTSSEAFFGIAAEARRLGLPFSGHIPMTVAPADASDAGLASIEHTETLFEGTFAEAHAEENLADAIAHWRTTEASALFDIFVRNGTMVDPTLVAQGYLLERLRSDEPDPRAGYMARSARTLADEALAGIGPRLEEFLAQRMPVFRELRETVRQLNQAGVELLAGSDSSYLHPPGFSLHDELELLVESGVSPIDALRAATSNPADLLGSESLGAIVVGAPADLVLLDANPLDDIRNTRRIRAVLLRGRHLSAAELGRLLDRARTLAESH